MTQNYDGTRTLSPPERILVYRPPSADTSDGYTKQPNNERPMEDVGERRHLDPSKEFPGFQLCSEVGCGRSGIRSQTRLCLVPANRCDAFDWPSTICESGLWLLENNPTKTP